jgi:hypothetical protein
MNMELQMQEPLTEVRPKSELLSDQVEIKKAKTKEKVIRVDDLTIKPLRVKNESSLILSPKQEQLNIPMTLPTTKHARAMSLATYQEQSPQAKDSKGFVRAMNTSKDHWFMRELAGRGSTTKEQTWRPTKNSTDQYGENPLHVALSNGKVRMGKVLP